MCLIVTLLMRALFLFDCYVSNAFSLCLVFVVTLVMHTFFVLCLIVTLVMRALFVLCLIVRLIMLCCLVMFNYTKLPSYHMILPIVTSRG